MFRIFRPKWKSKNAQRRIEAIKQDNLDQKTVLQLARQDHELSVRQVAVESLDDLFILYSLWLEERNSEGQLSILDRIALLVNEDENSDQQIKELIKRVNIRSFPLAKLMIRVEKRSIQEMLFEKVSSQRDLIFLVEHDDYFGHRALQSIQQPELLQEMLQEARENNKQSFRLLQERMDQLKEKEKAAQARERLLEAYQTIAFSEQLAALNRFSDLENEWKSYQLEDNDSEYQRLRQHYLERYRQYNETMAIQKAFIDRIAKTVETEDQDHTKVKAAKEELIAKQQEMDAFYQQDVIRLLEMIQQIEEKSRVAAKKDRAISALIKEGERLLRQKFVIEEQDILSLLERIKKATEINGDDCLNQLSQRLNNRLNQQRTSGSNAAIIESEIDTINAFIQEGNTEAAQAQLKTVNDLLKHSPNLSRNEYHQLDRHLKQVISPLREMQQWERWGSEQKLEELCENAEKLTEERGGSQYIVLRLRQLRSSWREASKSNYRKARELRQRFDEACEKAFAKVEAEREENKKHRDFYMDEARNLLTMLSQLIDQIDWENINWMETQQMRHDFLMQWNEYLVQQSDGQRISFGSPLFLNRDRRILEREMRAIMKPLNQAIDQAQKDEISRRKALINELEILAQDDNIRQIVNRAREVRNEFKARVRLRYRDENYLWRRFHRLNESIFKRHQEQMDVNDQERMINLEDKNRVLAELIQLSEEFGEDNIENLDNKLSDFEQKWESLGPVPRQNYRAIEDQFHQLKQGLIQKRREIIEQSEQQIFNDLVASSIKLAQLETKLLSGKEISLDEVELLNCKELRKRYNSLKSAILGDDEAQELIGFLAKDANEEARRHALLKEIILEKESPEEDRELRMELQIKHLPEFMTGNIHRDVNKQLTMLYNSWFEKIVGEVNPRYIERFFNVTEE